MTWREFQLRRAGYILYEKEEWKRTRAVTYYSLAATGAIDTRKVSIESFMPLDDRPMYKGGMTESQKEAMRQARERAKIQLDGSRT